MKTPKNKKHALTLSIEKYTKLKEKAQAGIQIAYEDIGGSTCACCIYSDLHFLFDEEGDEIECSNCPISEYTGEIGCANTPWPILQRYIIQRKKAKLPQTEQNILNHLQNEIDFLLQVQEGLE